MPQVRVMCVEPEVLRRTTPKVIIIRYRAYMYMYHTSTCALHVHVISPSDCRIPIIIRLPTTLPETLSRETRPLRLHVCCTRLSKVPSRSDFHSVIMSRHNVFAVFGIALRDLGLRSKSHSSKPGEHDEADAALHGQTHGRATLPRTRAHLLSGERLARFRVRASRSR